MGIVEIIVGGVTLVTAVTALIREIRGAKSMSRAQIIAEAEKVAFGIVEGMKERAKAQGKPMTREQMANAFKQAAYDYVVNKGLKGFTLNEVNALGKSAELLALAGKALAKRL